PLGRRSPEEGNDAVGGRLPSTPHRDRRVGLACASQLLVTMVARLVRQPAMEFGLFIQAHVPISEMERHPERAEHDRLIREADLAVACDEYNFKYVWSVEHHFLE